MMFKEGLLDGMTVFVAVAETGGFAPAARRLNRSTSYISKEISALEERLDVRLLHRSTRSVTLTEAGKTYLDRCTRILGEAEEAEAELSEGRASARGTLRVTVPSSLAFGLLDRRLPDFLAAHPDIKFDLDISEHQVDLVGEGYDLALRAGRLRDSDLVARKLAEARLMILAAPSYLEAHGTPTHPSDLAAHEVILFSRQQVPGRWQLQDDDGSPVTVSVKGQVMTSSGEMARALAVAGRAITRLPAFLCYRELAEGKLVPILEQYEEEQIGIYAVQPSRNFTPAKVAAFVGFLQEIFSNTDTCSLVNPPVR